MKKFLLIIAFLLTMDTVFAADFYSVGVYDFNRGQFGSARTNLEHAIRINPKNVNARYYLAQVYLSQNQVYEALNQYNRIILLNPTSDAALLSQKGISLIKSAKASSSIAVASSVNDYIPFVLTADGRAIKWKSFPVKIFIPNKVQKNIVVRAFKQWQDKSNGLVKFLLVNNPSSAQIIVNFKEQLENTNEDNNFVAGYSKPYIQGSYLQKSEIFILTKDMQTGKALEDNYIYFTALHEMGHTLGFQGHSPNSGDVMSSSATEPKLELSVRDINTLTALYSSSAEELKLRKNSNSEAQLNQAIAYANQFPNKAVAWSNLGDIYYGKKQYSASINAYQKAIKIEPEKAELYNLLGNAYKSSGNRTLAHANLKKSCDLDSDNEFYLYQFGVFCASTNQKNEGKIYLERFIKSNPEKTNDTKIKSLIKILN